MAETVVKTVENVDRLFPQIVVNGEVYESENYVAPTPSQSVPQSQPATVTPEPQSSQTEPASTQGEDIYGVDLNDVLHNFVDNTVPDKIQQAVQSLDVPSSGGSGKYIKSISQTDGKITATEGDITDSVTSGSSDPVTSGGAFNALYDAQYAGQAKNLGSAGWYKIAELGSRNRGQSIIVDLTRGFSNTASEAHHIIIEYGWKTAQVCEFAMASVRKFTKIKLCYNENNTNKMGLYVYYSDSVSNPCYASISGLCTSGVFPRSVELYNFETDTKTWDTELEFDLGLSGFYVNGSNLYKLEKSTIGLDANLCTANGVYETVSSNVPASGYNWVMEVMSKGDLYCFQKAYQCIANDNNPVIYIRKGRYVNSAWTFSVWKQMSY